DFLSFGLTNLIRRTVGRPTNDRTGLIERILSRGGILAADDLLHVEAHAFQDRLYSRGLPIDRWRQISSQVDASDLVKEIAAEIEVNFDLSSARVADEGQGIVKVASTLGSLVPSGLVIIGLVVMTRDVFIGNYSGLPMLWHLLAMTLLFFIALQGVVNVLLPGGSQRIGPAIGARAVQHVVRQRLGGWFASYRAELQADLTDFHEPLKILENLVAEDRDPLVLANSDGSR
ncbi:GTPase, partial [Singulisphaera rosea]